MSQKDEFDSPRAGGAVRVNLRDIIGKTVLFSPTEYIAVDKDDPTSGVKTADYGYKDAVITDMVVLDADGGPQLIADAMIFNGHPIAALKRRVGGKYLAVVEYGTERVKGNFPILLNPVSEEQKQMARDYLAGRAVAAATAPVSDRADDPFAV